MKKLAPVELVIEKRDSEFVPYDIVSMEVEVENEESHCGITDELRLLETGHIGLPDFDFPFEVGDRLAFKADFYGEFYSYWTDCGTEHDANFEFRDVKDLQVWKCVYDQAEAHAATQHEGVE